MPSRFRRLNGALADLPVEEPMLLTELDGFLTGVVVCPVAVPSFEYMTSIWGVETDGVPPFDDPLDVQWFADAVAARRDEIARHLSRGKLQPILDVDERDGDILWEYWIDGFAEAMALRPDAWEARDAGSAWSAALERLATLIAIARNDSDLDSMAINAFQDRAVAELSATVESLYAARAGSDAGAGAGPGAAGAAVPAKVGRNDRCPCGSGKKYKVCCA